MEPHPRQKKADVISSTPIGIDRRLHIRPTWREGRRTSENGGRVTVGQNLRRETTTIQPNGRRLHVHRLGRRPPYTGARWRRRGRRHHAATWVSRRILDS